MKMCFDRKVALDASISIYQFLSAIRPRSWRRVDDKETTSYLIGLIYMTIRIVENGLKSVYVLAGKASGMKLVNM
jgi:flap endonuclease-1